MKLPVATFLFIAFANCSYQDKDKSAAVSPPGYNIGNPEKIKVKEVLDEVSGIVYSKSYNAIMAVDDEQGRIFAIDLNDTYKYKMSKFAPPGDYEDLAFTGKEWFALKSSGDIYLVKNIFTDSATHEKFPFPEKGNEFEGLLYDDVSNSLWLLCKSCATDKSKEAVSVYAFDVSARQFKGMIWQIDVHKIKEQLSLKELSFRPSAIAMHPLQKQLYILSGVNKILVVADRNGNTQASYKLSPSNFKQPEGITFSENGDMYISNEATDNSFANILKFTYQPANK